MATRWLGRRSLPGVPAFLLAVLLLGVACTGAQRPDTAFPSPSPPAPPSPEQSPMPTPVPGACADRTTGGAVVAIRATEFRFRPPCVVVLGGHRIRVRNVGTALHNLTIEAEGGVVLDRDVPPGESFTTDPVGEALPGPGTWDFYCKYHRGRGMEGELEIVAAG